MENILPPAFAVLRQSRQRREGAKVREGQFTQFRGLKNTGIFKFISHKDTQRDDYKKGPQN